MANVTFIVGNGLDLSLGLKTSYRDFYEHIKSKRIHPENRIYKAIHESPESWADFELSLGVYTDYIDKLDVDDRKGESVKFHDELSELMDDLGNYLEGQQNALDIFGTVKLNSAGYFAELKDGQSGKILAQLSGGKSYRFLSLNYTNSLETILNNSENGLKRYDISITRPMHIHGDLTDDLTLGVSDETQISRGLTGAEKDDLIKPELISSMNDGRMEALAELIDSSDIIVLFGTSIGETDKYIWQKVTDWLSNGKERYVVVHLYDTDYDAGVRRSSRRRKQFNSNAQDKLLRYSGQDGDGIDALKNQTYVVYNTQSFFSS